MSIIVETSNVAKSYEGIKALENINISLEENKIYGLLGRNGAGKSTLLKILTSQIFADGGEIKIFGEKPYENKNVLKNICFIRDNGFFSKEFKVRNILDTAATAYPNWDKGFAQELVNKFEINVKKRFKTLSNGAKSIVGIIVGLASRAPLTIFDEPYQGLDSAARHMFYDALIKDYSENPRTIILSSHLIEEMGKIFEKVIIIKQGQLLMVEDTEALTERAYYISGARDKVDLVLLGKNILHTEEIGKLKICAVYNQISDLEKENIEELNLEVDSIPLEKLFIYLTEKQCIGKE
jgi:ABC-2 type transport system ATP-binding protein